jgi:hypothetical protein
MKNIQNIKTSCLALLLALTSMARSYSQTCKGNQVAITIENIRNTEANSVTFDVFITNTGTTSLALAAIQGSVIYDDAMIAKKASTTFSVTMQPSETGNFSKFENLKTKHSPTTNQLRWMQNPVNLSSGKTVNLPAQKKLKYASFKFTSSQPLNKDAIAKLKTQLKTKVGYTNILAIVYCNRNENSIALTSSKLEQNQKSLNEFSAIAYPNPFTTNFHLDVTTNSENTIYIKVYDMLGKLIENKSVENTELQDLLIGDNYPSGMYNLNISQDNFTQSLRIIKR